jgi:hypothetical protein
MARRTGTDRVALTLGTRLRRFGAARLSRAALLLAIIYPCCESSGTDLNFVADEGAPCDSCDDCKSLVNSCICHTCTEYAFDQKKKEVLICSSRGIWTVDSKFSSCPGGGSVACAGTGYDIRCLDENGNPIQK